jgi:hypothetical protein
MTWRTSAVIGAPQAGQLAWMVVGENLMLISLRWGTSVV